MYGPSILAPAVKICYLKCLLHASHIGSMANGGKRCTAGSPYDTVEMPDILFTAGSYTEAAAKAFITAGYPARRPKVISQR